MLKWSHTNTKSGAFRFSLDLAILFCYFGLISSSNTENGFREYFLYWIVTLFGLFIAWDVFKVKEYFNKNNNAKFNIALVRSFGKTVLFFTIFVMGVPFIFDLLLQNQVGIMNDKVIYGSVLIFSMFLMLLYRYWKWSVPPQRRPKNDINSEKTLPKL